MPDGWLMTGVIRSTAVMLTGDWSSVNPRPAGKAGGLTQTGEGKSSHDRQEAVHARTARHIDLGPDSSFPARMRNKIDVDARQMTEASLGSGYAVSNFSAGLSALSWRAACAATSLATGILKALQLT